MIDVKGNLCDELNLCSSDNFHTSVSACPSLGLHLALGGEKPVIEQRHSLCSFMKLGTHSFATPVPDFIIHRTVSLPITARQWNIT